MALLFDTHVQKMKYNVLREVAKLAYRDELTPQRIMEIAPRIIPEGKPMFRCCIYKERAIINERVSMALGGAPLTAFRYPMPAAAALRTAARITAPRTP